MSGITRSDLYLRSLKVHNQSSNIMEMDLQGNLNLNTKNINSDVKEDLNFRSAGNQNISTVNGNLTLSSKNATVVLRNGEYVDDATLLYNYNNLEVDETDNTYFQDNEILKPYTNKEDVVSLRDESLLIESLNDKKLTLYGNNGINLVSHNGIKTITDEDCIIQSNKKINLTSLGFITFNSERLISSVEENISFFSSTGDILLGGNGIINNGIKISSNSNHNFVGVGRNDEADRILDVEISNPSNDNNMKNGVRLINSSGEKDNNNNYINPELLLSNSESNTQISMGIGLNNNDENLKIIASKVNVGTNTYLKPLNNFSFSLQDIGIKVEWTDSNIQNTTINNIVNDSQHGIVGLINRESASQVRNFGYQIGYINRQNFSYLRTDTSSNLSLGTNGMNIINLTNTGDVGIGIETPIASFQVKNNYGSRFNNKMDKNRRYFNSKSIQFSNGNILVLSCSFKNSLYNLEGFLYNTNNQLTDNFIILENSIKEVVFSVDNLSDSNDLCVIAYCYYKNNTLNQKRFFTETNVFRNDGSIFSSTLLNTIEHSVDMTINSYPNIKGISSTILNGYILVYNNVDTELDSDDLYCMVQVFRNLVKGNQLSAVFNATRELYNTPTSRLNSNIQRAKIIEIISGYIGIEFDDLNNDILITNYNRITENNGTINYHTFLQRFTLQESGQVFSMSRKNFDNSFFIAIRHEVEHADNDLNGYKNYYIDGIKLKIVETSSSARKLRGVFYKRNTSGEKTGFFIKDINFQSGSSVVNSEAQEIQIISESSESDLLYDVPGIDVRSNGINIISWINENIIYYRQDSTIPGNNKILESNSSKQVFLLCTNDLTGNYKDTLVMWNNNDTNDDINYNSITMENVLSEFNLVNFKNNNSDISVKNTGEINITTEDKINLNNSLEIDKENNHVTVNTNLVLSDIGANPQTQDIPGVNGQINYFENTLWIYLGNNWRRIRI
jgi:hypothetical protein